MERKELIMSRLPGRADMIIKVIWLLHLQNQALLAAVGSPRLESEPGRLLKDLADTLTRLGRALEVRPSRDLELDILAILGRNGLLVGLVQLLNDALLVPEILLATDKDGRDIGAKVVNFGEPLFHDVVKRVGRVDRKANQDHMRVGVRKRAQTVIVLLASGIPEGELHVLAINLDVGNVVLENGGNIDLRESTLGEDDQKTRLATGTIANNDELLAVFAHGRYWRKTKR